VVEMEGSWVAAEIVLPPAEDQRKNKMMTEHLLPPVSSSFYCLSVLTEEFSLQLLPPVALVAGAYRHWLTLTCLIRNCDYIKRYFVSLENYGNKRFSMAWIAPIH